LRATNPRAITTIAIFFLLIYTQSL